MVEVRDFKFSVLIVRQTCKPKNAKVRHKGRSLRHVAYFSNFGTCCISVELVKLQASNLVCILTCKPKNANVGQEGRDLRHVTYFYNFETSSISLEGVKLEVSTCDRRTDRQTDTR